MPFQFGPVVVVMLLALVAPQVIASASVLKQKSSLSVGKWSPPKELVGHLLAEDPFSFGHSFMHHSSMGSSPSSSSDSSSSGSTSGASNGTGLSTTSGQSSTPTIPLTAPSSSNPRSENPSESAPKVSSSSAAPSSTNPTKASPTVSATPSKPSIPSSPTSGSPAAGSPAASTPLSASPTGALQSPRTPASSPESANVTGDSSSAKTPVSSSPVSGNSIAASPGQSATPASPAASPSPSASPPSNQGQAAWSKKTAPLPAAAQKTFSAPHSPVSGALKSKPAIVALPSAIVKPQLGAASTGESSPVAVPPDSQAALPTGTGESQTAQPADNHPAEPDTSVTSKITPTPANGGSDKANAEPGSSFSIPLPTPVRTFRPRPDLESSKEAKSNAKASATLNAGSPAAPKPSSEIPKEVAKPDAVPSKTDDVSKMSKDPLERLMPPSPSPNPSTPADPLERLAGNRSLTTSPPSKQPSESSAPSVNMSLGQKSSKTAIVRSRHRLPASDEKASKVSKKSSAKPGSSMPFDSSSKNTEASSSKQAVTSSSAKGETRSSKQAKTAASMHSKARLSKKSKASASKSAKDSSSNHAGKSSPKQANSLSSKQTDVFSTKQAEAPSSNKAEASSTKKPKVSSKKPETSSSDQATTSLSKQAEVPSSNQTETSSSKQAEATSSTQAENPSSKKVKTSSVKQSSVTPVSAGAESQQKPVKQASIKPHPKKTRRSKPTSSTPSLKDSTISSTPSQHLKSVAKTPSTPSSPITKNATRAVSSTSPGQSGSRKRESSLQSKTMQPSSAPASQDHPKPTPASETEQSSQPSSSTTKNATLAPSSTSPGQSVSQKTKSLSSKASRNPSPPTPSSTNRSTSTAVQSPSPSPAESLKASPSTKSPASTSVATFSNEADLSMNSPLLPQPLPSSQTKKSTAAPDHLTNATKSVRHQKSGSSRNSTVSKAMTAPYSDESVNVHALKPSNSTLSVKVERNRKSAKKPNSTSVKHNSSGKPKGKTAMAHHPNANQTLETTAPISSTSTTTPPIPISGPSSEIGAGLGEWGPFEVNQISTEIPPAQRSTSSPSPVPVDVRPSTMAPTDVPISATTVPVEVPMSRSNSTLVESILVPNETWPEWFSPGNSSTLSNWSDWTPAPSSPKDWDVWTPVPAESPPVTSTNETSTSTSNSSLETVWEAWTPAPTPSMETVVATSKLTLKSTITFAPTAVPFTIPPSPLVVSDPFGSSPAQNVSEVPAVYINETATSEPSTLWTSPPTVSPAPWRQWANTTALKDGRNASSVNLNKSMSENAVESRDRRPFSSLLPANNRSQSASFADQHGQQQIEQWPVPDSVNGNLIGSEPLSKPNAPGHLPNSNRSKMYHPPETALSTANNSQQTVNDDLMNLPVESDNSTATEINLLSESVPWSVGGGAVSESLQRKSSLKIPLPFEGNSDYQRSSEVGRSPAPRGPNTKYSLITPSSDTYIVLNKSSEMYSKSSKAPRPIADFSEQHDDGRDVKVDTTGSPPPSSRLDRYGSRRSIASAAEESAPTPRSSRYNNSGTSSKMLSSSNAKIHSPNADEFEGDPLAELAALEMEISEREARAGNSFGMPMAVLPEQAGTPPKTEPQVIQFSTSYSEKKSESIETVPSTVSDEDDEKDYRDDVEDYSDDVEDEYEPLWKKSTSLHDEDFPRRFRSHILPDDDNSASSSSSSSEGEMSESSEAADDDQPDVSEVDEDQISKKIGTPASPSLPRSSPSSTISNSSSKKNPLTPPSPSLPRESEDESADDTINQPSRKPKSSASVSKTEKKSPHPFTQAPPTSPPATDDSEEGHSESDSDEPSLSELDSDEMASDSVESTVETEDESEISSNSSTDESDDDSDDEEEDEEEDESSASAPSTPPPTSSLSKKKKRAKSLFGYVKDKTQAPATPRPRPSGGLLTNKDLMQRRAADLNERRRKINARLHRQPVYY